MRIIRSSAYRQMPWKNGGGITTEIAAFPDGAGTGEFEWRLSMARVERGGPFSLFPGVDRSIAILDGDGLALAIEGEDEVRLDRDSAPYPFAGDVATSATLTGGPVLDLNLMTRRDRWRQALMRRPAGPEDDTIDRAGDVVLLLARGTGVTISGDGGEARLAAGDTLLLDAGDPPLLRLAAAGSAGQLYLAHLWRR